MVYSLLWLTKSEHKVFFFVCVFHEILINIFKSKNKSKRLGEIFQIIMFNSNL